MLFEAIKKLAVGWWRWHQERSKIYLLLILGVVMLLWYFIFRS